MRLILLAVNFKFKIVKQLFIYTNNYKVFTVMNKIKKFTLCIPMYNEASIIADTAKTLSGVMQENLKKGLFESYEILFSDDGSTDSCGEIVKKLGLENVRVTGYSKNRGKGCAVRTAMLEAVGDEPDPDSVVMFTDADLAYGTGVIEQYSKAFLGSSDTDIFIGSRNLKGDGYEGYTFIRKLASKTYIQLLCLVGGFRLSDSQCGCKAFKAEAAKNIFSRAETDGFAFDFEAILYANRLGYKIGELPVKIINHRESKIQLGRDVFKMKADLFEMRRRVKNAKL